MLQVLTLSGLWLWGGLAVGLPLGGVRPFVLIATCLLTQAVLTARRGLRFEPTSALISSLSLTLLLRGDRPVVWIFAAVVSIGSKFWFRSGGKHVWNPTNFGIAVTVLLWDGVWISAGAWGQTAIFGYVLVGFCALTVYRTARGDVTWTVIVAWAAMLFGRATWLGDPWTIPLHQLMNGSFWIFAFLMISDPKTLPDARPMRILYGVFVTLVTYLWTFVGYRENGWIWALFMLAPIVPLLDRFMPAARYQWKQKVKKENRNAYQHICVDDTDDRVAGLGLLRILRRQGGRQPVQRSLPGGDRTFG